MAIVFTMGVTVASAGTVTSQKASTEQVTNKDEKKGDKTAKAEKAEKKKEGCDKSCDKAKKAEKK